MLPNCNSDHLLQAMKDDDDFYFNPLPLERQETIYDDPQISKAAMNQGMVSFMTIFPRDRPPGQSEEMPRRPDCFLGPRRRHHHASGL